MRIERAASAVGALYGINTLGAAAGALVATWVLLPAYGLEGSLRIGAALNMACALVVLPAAWLMKDAGPASEPKARFQSDPGSDPGAGQRLDCSSGLAVYLFSGFVALSYEIVWFRLLGVVVKSTAFTFGTLLTLYLAGIGLARSSAARARRGPLTPPGRSSRCRPRAGCRRACCSRCSSSSQTTCARFVGTSMATNR